MDRNKKKEIVFETVGNVCYICREGRLRTLQLHHLDPKSKNRDIKDVYSLGTHRLIEEAKHCVLLCANCHILIHSEDPETTYKLYSRMKHEKKKGNNTCKRDRGSS